MSQLPSLTGREVITALGKIGFEVARVRGSHLYI
jgi:predicted RNA binding protein YcfA (HicA-like mRNA interferase family)